MALADMNPRDTFNLITFSGGDEDPVSEAGSRDIGESAPGADGAGGRLWQRRDRNDEGHQSGFGAQRLAGPCARGLLHDRWLRGVTT